MDMEEWKRRLHTAVENPMYIPFGLRNMYCRYIADRYFKQADFWAGSRILENAAGLNRTLAGKLAVKKASLLAESEPDWGAGAREKADELHENGYLELGKLNDSLVQEVISKYNALMEEGDSTYTRGGTENAPDPQKCIWGHAIRNRIPEVAELITEDVQEIFRAYYQIYFKVIGLTMYRTYYIPPEKRADSPSYNWHSDGCTTDHMKLFILLSDTTEQDGPMHLISKPESGRISASLPGGFKRERDGAPGGEVEQEADVIKFTGEAGTAMLASTAYCLHRAGIPEEGRTRDILQFYLAPASRPYSTSWVETPLPERSIGRYSRLFDY